MKTGFKITDKDLGFKRIKKEVNKAAREKPEVKAGWLAGQGGDQLHSNSNLTNSQLATIHEFGSPVNNLPKRPVVANSVKESETEVAKLTEDAINNMLKGRGLDSELEAIAELLEKAIKRQITSGKLVPTKDGRRPLLNTGELLRAISSKVES